MLGALAADRSRVADLDVEILVLEQALSALRVQRTQAQDRLDAYKYPVLTFPNEITAEIFTHFLPNYPYCPTLIGGYSPTLLTQVCRKWREIALQTPTLWRAISLPDRNIPVEEQKRLSDVWLSRSPGCPISFHYDKDLNEDSGEAEFLSTIAPYRARLEDLVVNLDSISQLRAIEGPLPLLHRLVLLLEEPDDPLTKVSFLEAPLLRTVLLEGICVDDITLPWTQLTSLALYAIPPRRCAPVLRQTLNLVHCELLFVGDLADTDALDATLPSLQSLALTHVREDYPMTGFLQTLIVPALCSLRVPEPSLGPDPTNTLQSFVSRSGCKLQELCVMGTKPGSNASYDTAFPSAKISFTGWTMYHADPWLNF
ncbi:F-box domain-containing protein [Mycena sanguinolenta]|uniref:F-box domain-containing protein n=1 Tax=Mycena sanguinolenta TaxID=230812 RepID=A0A8H7DCX6_9AGAR|nr:F-box domain-containing protein [Mycena sanguinolenta]